jgi:hypothetical protein
VVAADSAEAAGSVAADDGVSATGELPMNRMITILLAGASILSVPALCSNPKPEGKGFRTPEAAAQALVNAAKSDNVAELTAILGPSAKAIVSTEDPVADRNARREFAARAAQKTKLIPNRDRPNERIMLAGTDEWPMPIPIVEVNGQWYFDTVRGKREILVRRIGSNELDAIDISRGYVEAQNEYAEQHRTAEGTPYYAQKIISSPGQQDGLYWPAEPGKPESPIGEFVARAIAEGYTKKGESFHGYYFRVLTAQGPHASGHEMDYRENGAMTKGFALIAWPASYRSTGIMTFVVDKSGIVYQKDLGPDTGKIAAGYKAYDPDPTWRPINEKSLPVTVSRRRRSPAR